MTMSTEQQQQQQQTTHERPTSENYDFIREHFTQLVTEHPDMSLAVVGITVLTMVIKNSCATTMMELDNELRSAVTDVKIAARTLQTKNSLVRGSSIALTSGCELFLRFVTRQSLEIPEFTACKKKLMERGQYITRLSAQSRQKISNLFAPFFRDNMTVLVNGYSRAVVSTLANYAKQSKRFSVIVPECRPDCEGYKTVKELQAAGVPVKLVIDSAVAHIMGRVDFVLSGAEGVVENGGIVNKIGTYQMAIAAKAMKKPFYVAAESFKFVRQFPLSQADIANFEYFNKPDYIPVETTTESPSPEHIENPISDFTPPKYISLLFTDLGILTPSGISDELIKLFM